MKDKSKRPRWKSRKLWMAIGGIVAGAAFPPLLPLLKIALPAYLGAQGAADCAETIGEAMSSK